jgi:hypothetical protein
LTRHSEDKHGFAFLRLARHRKVDLPPVMEFFWLAAGRKSERERSGNYRRGADYGRNYRDGSALPQRSAAGFKI